MSLADVGALITEDRRQVVLAETFGHLAPQHRWYRGSLTFIHGYYGELTVLDVAIADLDDSPWFYEGLHDWLCGLTTDPGRVYRWVGSYRWCKNGVHQFPGCVRQVARLPIPLRTGETARTSRPARPVPQVLEKGQGASTMVRFRKRPVEIDAVKVADLDGPFGEPNVAWAEEALTAGLIQVSTSRVVTVVTLEGTMRADPDGWIVRGVKGELYPVRNDIFEATYEAVP